MDMIQLQYFQILAREQNMSRTAEKLHVAQPAISASLARLEKEVGVRLFDRKGKKIILNVSGQIFLEFTDRVLNDLEQTQRMLERQNSTGCQEITIACNSFMATQDMFFTYMAEHPMLRLKQYSVTGPDIMKELKNERCDFAVTTIPISGHNPDLESCHLMTQEIGLIVHAEHPFADRSWIDLSEAKAEKFICMQQGTAFRQTTDEMCRRAGFVPDVIMEYFPSQLMSAVEHSHGVALGICYEERQIYFNTIMRFIPIRSPECHRDVTLLWKRSREREPNIRNFIDFANIYKHKKDLDNKNKIIC